MISAQYAAGFFDGEGCVNCATNRGGSPFVRILIVNTNLEVLERFKETWGGDINKNYKSKEHWKQAYTWRLSHTSAGLFLEEILPYLIVKKKQSELAIEFINIRPGKGKRWSDESLKEAVILLDRIRQANKKGIEI
jgi:hypothetical protein